MNYPNTGTPTTGAPGYFSDSVDSIVAAQTINSFETYPQIGQNYRTYSLQVTTTHFIDSGRVVPPLFGTASAGPCASKRQAAFGCWYLKY